MGLGDRILKPLKFGIVNKCGILYPIYARFSAACQLIVPPKWLIPQLWIQVIQLFPLIPLFGKEGARGDFIRISLKSPFIPLCQRGIKTPESEVLPKALSEIWHIILSGTPVF